MFYGLIHTDEQVLDDRLEPTNNNSLKTQDVV